MRILAVVTACVLVLAACTVSAPTPGGNAPGLRAAFILANPAGLLALDEVGRTLGRVADLPANSAPATPTLHPSGKAIAFALTQVPTKPANFGSDIFAANLDGTGLRMLVEHEGDAVFYATPLYDSTGNVLYVHRRAAIVKNGSLVGNDDQILRIDLRTGDRTTVVKDGADPALSPDGRTIVYVHIKEDKGDGLWAVGVDGTNPHPVLKGRDSFYYLQSPRFAPSGDQIAFSAAGHATSRGASGGRLAHLGVPSEIFLVGTNGTGLRSVGQTGDDVTPAWSPDGKQIAYIGTGAFFVLTLASGNVRSLVQGNDFFFGDLLWIR